MTQLGYNNMIVHRRRNPHSTACMPMRVAPVVAPPSALLPPPASLSHQHPRLNTLCLSTLASQLALLTPAHSYRPV